MKKKLNLNKSTKNTLITIGMVVVAYIIMTILASAGVLSSLMKGLLVPLCIYAIIAVALNLTVGILGELSLGHAGFMCVGAFSSAFFSLCFKDTMAAGPRFLLAIIIGALVSALFGLLIGIPVLRLQGDYLAIVTLAFGEIIKSDNGCKIAITDSSKITSHPVYIHNPSYRCAVFFPTFYNFYKKCL